MLVLPQKPSRQTECFNPTMVRLTAQKHEGDSVAALSSLCNAVTSRSTHHGGDNNAH